MEVIHPRCAGLDVHKESVVACVRLANGAKISREVRTFETTTLGKTAAPEHPALTANPLTGHH